MERTRLCGRSDAPGRQALCHRERPLGLRSRRPRLFSQATFPDADAQRAPGHAAYGLRRSRPHPDDPLGGPRAATVTCAARMEGLRSRLSSAVSCRKNCADRPRCCMAKVTASRMSPRKVVSIINLASVAAVENAAGAPVDPLRFRGNLYVAGWPAWHEFDLLGLELAVGQDCAAESGQTNQRCAATDVDPETGIRDLTIPRTLHREFRPHRLRRLCRSHNRRRYRGRRRDQQRRSARIVGGGRRDTRRGASAELALTRRRRGLRGNSGACARARLWPRCPQLRRKPDRAAGCRHVAPDWAPASVPHRPERLRRAARRTFGAILLGLDRGEQFGNRRIDAPSDGARRSLVWPRAAS